MLKLWTSSALKGNGLAMAGLAQEHRDLGCQATANTWWEKALTVVELPEAAYNLGVSYALQEYPEAIFQTKNCSITPGSLHCFYSE